MIILGIDPGTRETGFGVVECLEKAERPRNTNRESALDYGSVRTKKGVDHSLRLRRIYDAVTDVIERHLPDVVAVEMPIYSKSASAMLKLGRAQGAVMLAASHREIPVAQYTPAEVKKAVVGNGAAAKEQVWSMLRVQLQLTEHRGLDASDALAVALCHAHRLSMGPKKGKTRAPKQARNWKEFVASNPDRVKG